MKDFLDIVGIRVVADARGRHAFVVLLDGPRGQQQVTLGADALQDYEQAQREILIGTGCLFRYFLAESMPREAANCCWRNYVDTLLAAFWRMTPAATGSIN